jgi:P-type conjugative transfer protein TrbG
MNWSAWTGSLTLAAMLSACAANQPAPPPAKIATVEAPPAPAQPPPTGAQLLAAQPAEVREAVKEHEQDGKWPVYKTPTAALYPFDEGSEPIVDCRPLRTTDIQLQAGETITDAALGDAERWMATPASSGDPREPTPHLAIKPQQPGIETNLTIYTTKHIYHLLLRSRGRAMREVEFYYPDELLTEMKQADAAAARAKEQSAVDPPGDNDGGVVKVATIDPGRLNFSYDISGPNVPWRPVRAFDDGAHVYIEMAPGMEASEAPALLIGAPGGTQMVNYRVKGDYYVVDRLFERAALVSGWGASRTG